jgi:hypothetical protein
MGFRPPRKIYALDFTGTEFEGLEVKMRGVTVGEELEQDALKGKDGFGRYIFELTAKLLVEWNVEDDEGKPVPATLEGVCSQDGTMIMAIINALQAAVSGVPDPLPQSSPSGGPSPEVSAIPMEPLSLSPQSSAVPA